MEVASCYDVLDGICVFCPPHSDRIIKCLPFLLRNTPSIYWDVDILKYTPRQHLSSRASSKRRHGGSQRDQAPSTDSCKTLKITLQISHQTPPADFPININTIRNIMNITMKIILRTNISINISIG